MLKKIIQALILILVSLTFGYYVATIKAQNQYYRGVYDFCINQGINNGIPVEIMHSRCIKFVDNLMSENVYKDDSYNWPY